MKIKVICGALVVKGKKFAIVQEAQGQVRGLWNLPAGHLNDDENIFKATIREVKEETGLDVEITGLIGVYQHRSPNDNNVIGFYFLASVVGGELKHNSKEILDSKWVTCDEFLNFEDSIVRAPHLKEVVKDYLKQGCSNDLIHIAGL